MAAGPVQGVYWLPALDSEGSLGDMDLAVWREALRLLVKSLYTTMRIMYAQIAQPGTFLVSATRLGGQHGYDKAGAVEPLGGAVVGFTKAYKRERMEALVKAVDFVDRMRRSSSSTPSPLAALIAVTVLSAADHRFAIWFCAAALAILGLFRVAACLVMRLARRRALPRRSRSG